MQARVISRACRALVLALLTLNASAGEPVLLGAFTTGIDASDVVLLPASSNACVAGSRFQKNFQVIGVTNASAPAFVAQLSPNDDSGDRLTLSADHQRAYMVGFLGGMKIISTANPNAPTQIGTFGHGGSRAADVAISSDRLYAFVADESAGIQAVSLAQETLPLMVGQYQSIFSNQYNAAGLTIAPDDRHLYVAAQNNGLIILSITNPASPTWVGQLPLPPGSGALADIHLAPDGDIAYAVGGEGGGDFALHIISVTNPAAPSLLTRYADPQRGESFADIALSPDGSTAFLVGNNVGLQVVDISRGTTVHYISEFYEEIGELSPQATGIALSPDGNTAYIAQKSSGLRILDVSGVYDIDDDGLPNAWEIEHFNSPVNASATADSDFDGHSNFEEFVSGSNPQDDASFFRIVESSGVSPATLSVNSLDGRIYDLIHAALPGSNDVWMGVNGATNRPGTGGPLLLSDTNRFDRQFYRVNVRLAP